MNIISRKEAKELGLKTYFTGKSCKHGHICEHRTDHGNCVKCGRMANSLWRKNNDSYNKERLKKWKKENKKHIAEYVRLYGTILHRRYRSTPTGQLRTVCRTV